MLKKKFLPCQSAFGRYTYSNFFHSSLEPTISVTTTQPPPPPPHLVTTTGVTSSQDGVIPIASLFSSSDLGQFSTSTKKRASTPGTPLRRATSFQLTEQDREQANM